MNKQSLEQIIRMYVNLSPPNAKGWEGCVHLGCDHGKKGPRAAFNFQPNGGVIFHCFNCGIKTGLDPSKHKSIPYKLKQVLNDFSIPEDAINEYQLYLLTNTDSSSVQRPQPIVLDIHPKTIQFPSNFYPLSSANNNDKWATIAQYILEERKISTEYPFYLASRTNTTLDKWCKRIIIPIYKQGKLIYWIGRDLTGKAIKKYLSPPFPKNNIIYGYDYLYENIDKPLFVMEGIFDAMSLGNSVAILGNEISKEQMLILSQSPRRKIYVPDRWGNGHIAATQFIQNGWEISIPEVSSEIKDINDAVIKYGKLYVLSSLMNNISSGFNAEVQLKLMVK